MVPLTVKSIKVKWFGISSVFYIFVEHCLAAWKYRISLLMLKNIAPILKEKLGKSIWPYKLIIPSILYHIVLKLLYLIYTKALVRHIKIKLVEKKHKQMETETKKG